MPSWWGVSPTSLRVWPRVHDHRVQYGECVGQRDAVLAEHGDAPPVRAAAGGEAVLVDEVEGGVDDLLSGQARPGE